MSEPGRDLLDLPLFVRAEMALREAVAEAIEYHRRTGKPLVTWRDGKVVLVPADSVTPPTITPVLQPEPTGDKPEPKP